MDLFGQLCGLKVLKLNNNLLRSLPPSLAGLKALERFEAKSNYIKALPVKIRYWEHIQVRTTGGKVRGLKYKTISRGRYKNKICGNFR